MKHTYFSLLGILLLLTINTGWAQCPNQLTNQSTSIILSPGYPRSGTAATGVQIGASCGLQIVGNLGATWARYEIPINVADNALVPGDQIEISMDITNVTANFQYDVKGGSTTLDGSAQPVSGRIITVPSGATTLLIRLFTNAGQSDIGGSFDISNLSVSKVGAESNDTQPPNIPTNLAVSNIASDSAYISWNTSNDNGGGSVSGYKVYNNDGTELADVSSTSTTLNGLNEQANYTISVAAYDNADPSNFSSPSSTISFTTLSSGGDSSSSDGGSSNTGQIEYYEGKLSLGNPSTGWYKLATFDLAGNGNNNSVVVDANINYTRTGELAYLANAKLFIREGASQQGKWQYDISGTQIGDYLKYKKVDDTTYELFGYSAGNYGHMSIRLAVTREAALNITIPNSPISIANPDVYTTVPLVGKTSFLGGNVGIGTTNAASKLSVSNGSSSGSHHSFSDLTVEDDDNTMINLLSPSNKVGYYGFSDSDDTYVGGMHYEHSFDSMIFRVNNHAHDMVILNNGNVGIGTLAPDAELAVNGNIHAKEVKIDLIGWPDYVFKSNYSLPTLEEVEKHIKEKGHLINIPSAKEVEENGVQLGEMNKLLLEKIEELTLYAIEQQKALQQQKEINLNLIQRLEKIENQVKAPNDKKEKTNN